MQHFSPPAISLSLSLSRIKTRHNGENGPVGAHTVFLKRAFFEAEKNRNQTDRKWGDLIKGLNNLVRKRRFCHFVMSVVWPKTARIEKSFCRFCACLRFSQKPFFPVIFALQSKCLKNEEEEGLSLAGGQQKIIHFGIGSGEAASGKKNPVGLSPFFARYFPSFSLQILIFMDESCTAAHAQK